MLHCLIVLQRHEHSSLQSQFEDLLGLLAQQEVEKKSYRGELQRLLRANSGEFNKILQDARDKVVEQYGAYVNYDSVGR